MKTSSALVAALLALAACNKTDAPPAAGSSAPVVSAAPVTTAAAAPAKDAPAAPAGKHIAAPDGEDGLKQVLEALAKDAKGTLPLLRPDDADYAAVFEATAAEAVKKETEDQFARDASRSDTLGKPGDPLRVVATNADELEHGTGNARQCPGGYKRVGPALKPDVKLWCAHIGHIGIDAFVYENGHWALFPKPFRALKR